MTIAWTTELETGNRQIDLQHQELIDIINKLRGADKAGNQADHLDEVLSHLAVYVIFHFGTEEVMMGDALRDNPHVAAHVREHRLFADRLAGFRALPREEQEQTLPSMLEFLESWLTWHILTTDRELTELLTPSPIRKISPVATPPAAGASAGHGTPPSKPAGSGDSA